MKLCSVSHPIWNSPANSWQKYMHFDKAPLAPFDSSLNQDGTTESQVRTTIFRIITQTNMASVSWSSKFKILWWAQVVKRYLSILGYLNLSQFHGSRPRTLPVMLLQTIQSWLRMLLRIFLFMCANICIPEITPSPYQTMLFLTILLKTSIMSKIIFLCWRAIFLKTRHRSKS